MNPFRKKERGLIANLFQWIVSAVAFSTEALRLAGVARKIKIELAKLHLCLAESMRSAYIVLTVFLIVIAGFWIGVLLLLGGLLYFLPWTPDSKIIAVLVLGGLLFLISSVFLLMAGREQTWFRLAHCDESVNRALRRD